MKRFFIGMGALCIVLLLVSSATAVPQVHSEPLMKNIEKIEEAENLIEMDGNLFDFIKTNGLIDLLIQLIKLIIQVIMEIIEIINSIIAVINLINYVIEALQILFDLIGQLIEIIQDLFNPSATF